MAETDDVVPSKPPWWHMALTLLVLLVVVACVGALAWWVTPRASTALRGFQQEVLATLALGTVTVAFYFWRRISELRESVREHLRSHRVPVYDRFLTFWFTILFQGAKKGQQPDADQLNDFVTESVPGFIFWASDDVIRQWNQLRHDWANMADEKRKDPTNLFALEDLMLSMRKDLGQKNKKLRRGDLLALWINDMDRLLPATGQQGKDRAKAR